MRFEAPNLGATVTRESGITIAVPHFEDTAKTTQIVGYCAFFLVLEDANVHGKSGLVGWIGANDRHTQGTFVWAEDNSRVSYTNWLDDPNDHWLAEDCVVLVENDHGKWVVSSCYHESDSSAQLFWCQWVLGNNRTPK